MSRLIASDRPKAVLFDAGGVLVTPSFETHQALVGSLLSVEDVRRRFYAAYTETSMPTESELFNAFWPVYAQRLGLGQNPFRDLDPQRERELIRWNQPALGARETVATIKAEGIGVAVVSNASGDVDLLLEEAGVCHVDLDGWEEEDEYKGTRVDVIFDSGDTHRYPDERLSRKPNPTMINDALRHFGVGPMDVLFVGDALWSDVLAAQQAGVPFLHLDPFGDCRDVTFPEQGVVLRSADHDHVASMYDVLPYALGERPRGTVANTPYIDEIAGTNTSPT